MRHPFGRTRSGRGQSLAEFALVLPVLLLILLIAIDFGRAFYSWVTVTNAARVAANYAGLNPTASFGQGSTYDQLIRSDAINSTCPIPTGPPPQPDFTDSALDSNVTEMDLGDDVTVGVTCSFRILTPIIGDIVGSPLSISASATFTVRRGPANP